MTNIEMIAKIEFDVFSGGGAFSDDRVADLVWDALELVLRHESLDVYGSDAECGRGWKAHSQKSGCRPIKKIFDAGSSSTNSPRSLL